MKECSALAKLQIPILNASRFRCLHTSSSLSCRQALLQHCFQVHELMCRIALWYAKHRMIVRLFKTKMSDLEDAFSASRPCATSCLPFRVLLADCRATAWPYNMLRTLLPPPMLTENSSKDVLPPPANRFHASRLFQGNTMYQLGCWAQLYCHVVLHQMVFLCDLALLVVPDDNRTS